jgi:acyl carrier protein
MSVDRFSGGLADILEVDVAKIVPALDLTQLAWDSLAIVSTMALIDECYGVLVSGKALGQCRTVGDIEQLVAAAR